MRGNKELLFWGVGNGLRTELNLRVASLGLEPMDNPQPPATRAQHICEFLEQRGEVLDNLNGDKERSLAPDQSSYQQSQLAILIQDSTFRLLSIQPSLKPDKVPEQ